MKRMLLGAGVVLALLLAAGCSDPVGGSNSSGGTPPPATSKVPLTADAIGPAGKIYNPSDGLTKVATTGTLAIDSGVFIEGSSSLKVTNTLQEDKYSTVKEMGIRIKAPALVTGVDLSTADMRNKVITLKMYVPADSKATGMQFVLGAGSDAISAAVNLTPGVWNTLYFKADTGYTVGGYTSLNQIDSSGLVLQTGAYTSDKLDLSAVAEFAVRLLVVGSDTGVIGDTASFYLGSLEWSNTVAETKVAAPSFSPVAGTYGTDQSLSLASSTAGASVFYTITSDGATPADPTSGSTKFTSALPLTVPATGTTTYKVKAIAIKTGVVSSDIVSATFTMTKPAATLSVNLGTVGVGYQASFAVSGSPTFAYSANYGLGGFTLPAVKDLTGYTSMVVNATSNGQFVVKLFSDSLGGAAVFTDYPAYGVTSATTADYTLALGTSTLTSVAAVGIGDITDPSVTVKVNSITFKDSNQVLPDVTVDVTTGTTAYNATVAFSAVTFAYSNSYGRAGFSLPTAIDLSGYTNALVDVTSNGPFQFILGTGALYENGAAFDMLIAYPASGVSTSTTATYTIPLSSATGSLAAIKAIVVGANGSTATTVKVNSITFQ